MNTEQSKPTIEINDLVAVVQLIDVCSTRGAFRGEELATVGAMRTKFAEIVKSQQPPAPVPEAPKAE
jgi:hypothetical protein